MRSRIPDLIVLLTVISLSAWVLNSGETPAPKSPVKKTSPKREIQGKLVSPVHGSPQVLKRRPPSGGFEDHRWVSLNSTAWDYSRQGDDEKAIEAFENALRYAESAGLENFRVDDSLTALAVYYYNHDQAEEADRLLHTYLSKRIEVFGEESAPVASVLASQAGLWFGHKRYEAAAEYYERAYEIRHKILGPDHVKTAEIQLSLSELNLDLGQLEISQKLYDRAIAVYEAELSADFVAVVRQNRVERLRRHGYEAD